MRQIYAYYIEHTTITFDVQIPDMEAYAQAQVCRELGIPFLAVKYVTDIVGQNSVKHWEDKLADARRDLTAYFKGIGQ